FELVRRWRRQRRGLRLRWRLLGRIRFGRSRLLLRQHHGLLAALGDGVLGGRRWRRCLLDRGRLDRGRRRFRLGFGRHGGRRRLRLGRRLWLGWGRRLLRRFLGRFGRRVGGGFLDDGIRRCGGIGNALAGRGRGIGTRPAVALLGHGRRPIGWRLGYRYR